MESEVNNILVAAHDLKAPLCLMRQLALSLSLAPDDSTRQRIESELVDVSNRALRLVNDLTKVARLEDGLFPMEPVGVRGVCEEVYRELNPLFRYESRTLEVVYNNRARLAVANRELLHSIIYNFCTNAVHYSDQSTASIMTVSEHHGCLRVGVRDFGPALPVAVWRELHQTGGLARPTKIAMRSGSSGLGLYVSSEFARHMHAQVGAIRHHDGTSFYIDLPISRQLSLFEGL